MTGARDAVVVGAVRTPVGVGKPAKGALTGIHPVDLSALVLARLARETIACADSVGRIARKARVKKLVLTHFRRSPDAVIQSIASDVARDYDGHVVLGSDLLEVTI